MQNSNASTNIEFTVSKTQYLTKFDLNLTKLAPGVVFRGTTAEICKKKTNI